MYFEIGFGQNRNAKSIGELGFTLLSKNMLKCSTGKRIYTSREAAVEALLEAHIHYDYAIGHGPLAVYRCDDCGCFHLTSKGPIDQALSKELSTKKIDLQKEANRWLGKFKKR